MATDTTMRANFDDLLRVKGKAELIGGRIMHLMPSGDLPGFVAGEIFVSLRLHTRATKRGTAHADGRSTDPSTPIVFHSGDIANAEPAVPGWTVAVDELFAY